MILHRAYLALSILGRWCAYMFRREQDKGVKKLTAIRNAKYGLPPPLLDNEESRAARPLFIVVRKEPRAFKAQKARARKIEGRSTKAGDWANLLERDNATA